MKQAAWIRHGECATHRVGAFSALCEVFFVLLVASSLFACVGPLSNHAFAQTIPVNPSAQSTSKPRESTLEEYRAHLQSLDEIVQACAKARDMKSCDPALVGADDLVPVSSAQNASRRLIRYGWLRVLISEAREKDKPKTAAARTESSQAWENARPIPPTTSELMISAQNRLHADIAQTNSPQTSSPNHATERAVLAQVLAERDFSGVEPETPQDATAEKFGNWLNHVLERAIRASSRAPWLGRALVWGFFSCICGVLIWVLIRLERRWRARASVEEQRPASDAPSNISWQSWLENARKAAASRLWRDAIHLLYWAAISRLESKRLWPADRARTPREYLRLLASDDPRRPTLSILTRSFERVWYGGREARASDYDEAEQLAIALIHGLGSSTTPHSAALAGGAE